MANDLTTTAMPFGTTEPSDVRLNQLVKVTSAIWSQINGLTEFQRKAFQNLSKDMAKFMGESFNESLTKYGDKERSTREAYERKREASDRLFLEKFEEGFDKLEHTSKEQVEILNKQLREAQDNARKQAVVFEGLNNQLKSFMDGPGPEAKKARQEANKAELREDNKSALGDFGMGMAAKSPTLTYLLKSMGITKETRDIDQKYKREEARHDAGMSIMSPGSENNYAYAAQMKSDADKDYYTRTQESLGILKRGGLGELGPNAVKPSDDIRSVEAELVDDPRASRGDSRSAFGLKSEKNKWSGSATANASDVARSALDPSGFLYLGGILERKSLDDGSEKKEKKGGIGDMISGAIGKLLPGLLPALGSLIPLVAPLLPIIGAVVGSAALLYFAFKLLGEKEKKDDQVKVDQMVKEGMNPEAAAKVVADDRARAEASRQEMALSGGIVTYEGPQTAAQLAAGAREELKSRMVTQWAKIQNSRNPTPEMLQIRNRLIQMKETDKEAEGPTALGLMSLYLGGDATTRATIDKFHKGGVAGVPRDNNVGSLEPREVNAILESGELVQPADIAPLYKEIALNTKSTNDILGSGVVGTLLLLNKTLESILEATSSGDSSGTPPTTLASSLTRK